jgi:hypothetical protein
MYSGYLECIRLSIPDYPEVLQLQQSIDNTLLTLPADQQTLARAHEIVSLRAPNVIDALPPPPRHHRQPHSLHSVSYNIHPVYLKSYSSAR